MRSEGYMALRAEYNVMFDGGDPWGSNIEWLFALAEFVYHNEPDMVPESWDFHDSPMHVPPFSPDDWGHVDAMIWEMYDDELITLEDAVTFGNVLSRYDNLLRMAGKDY